MIFQTKDFIPQTVRKHINTILEAKFDNSERISDRQDLQKNFDQDYVKLFLFINQERILFDTENTDNKFTTVEYDKEQNYTKKLSIVRYIFDVKVSGNRKIEEQRIYIHSTCKGGNGDWIDNDGKGLPSWLGSCVNTKATKGRILRLLKDHLDKSESKQSYDDGLKAKLILYCFVVETVEDVPSTLNNGKKTFYRFKYM